MYTSIYSKDTPELINQLIETPEMQRLSDIGMHCGCEYAAFPVYQRARGPFSRLTHSMGVAGIVWSFTHDTKQAVAGLLHDIATPVFAHAIDFLYGDYLTQEATEGKTLQFIERSKAITDLLRQHGIRVEDVCDYHQYPIADNDTPMLSADRLEYTLGNGYIVYNSDLAEIQHIYDDIFVAENEYGVEELCFRTIEAARAFHTISMRNSRWFVSDEDRFSMQYIADMMRGAVEKGVLTPNDLYTSERYVISKLRANVDSSHMWNEYTRIAAVEAFERKRQDRYCVQISAKKRFIDPLVFTDGSAMRLSMIDPDIRASIDSFLALDFSNWISAKPPV